MGLENATNIPVRDRLIVALDLPTQREALEMVEKLGDSVSFYKVGLQLFLAPDGSHFTLAKFLSGLGKKIMIDLKLFDVPQTVANAVDQLNNFHTTFATVHAQEEEILRAAVARKNEIQILGVTVLTSMDEADLRFQGFPETLTVQDLVLRRAQRALELGCDGVVASGQEASALRAQPGAGNPVIVTPGIRPSTNGRSDDQKRTVDVEDAFRGGADYIVVGRPIRDAPDPAAKATEIQERISGLFS